MIRCVSWGDSRIASDLTTATTGDFGSMGGCVFTVSPRPSDSSDNLHFPAGGERADRFSISYSVTGTSGDWGGSIIAAWDSYTESSDLESDPRLSAFPDTRVRIDFGLDDTVAIGGPYPDHVFAGLCRREVVLPHCPDVG